MTSPAPVRLPCTAAPDPTRVLNALGGGKDHYERDRLCADDMAAAAPALAAALRDHHRFHARAVRSLVSDYGAARVVDLGPGLPRPHDNTHDLVPGRTLYVDADPQVLTHARALLEGPRASVLAADVRDTPAILGALPATPSGPVGVLALLVLDFLPDDDARAMLAALVAGLPRHSAVVISHVTCGEEYGTATAAAVQALNAATDPDITARMTVRTPSEVADLVTGAGLAVEWGPVSCATWREDGPALPVVAALGVKD